MAYGTSSARSTINDRFRKVAEDRSRKGGRGSLAKQTVTTRIVTRVPAASAKSRLPITQRLGKKPFVVPGSAVSTAKATKNIVGAKKQKLKKQAASKGRIAKATRPLRVVKARPKGKAAKTKEKTDGPSKRAKAGKKQRKPLTKDNLDAELDTYMMKDVKTGRAILDQDIDSYMGSANIDLQATV